MARLSVGTRDFSPTFAVEARFRPLRQKIPFAFNVGIAETDETGQVKTLPLF